jgi:glycosyltransferase involved in cell wall biosynthesis
MSPRPAILVFVQYFRPAYRAGGAARSIANLVDHLGDEFDFHVVCRDRDLGDREPFALPRAQWTEVGKAKVWYEPLSARSPLTMLRLLRSRRWDAVYCNSYFNPVFSITPRLFHRFGLARTKGLVVAPRGEFAQDAIKISGAKKRRVLRLAKWLGIDNGVMFQASVEHEARDIARHRPWVADQTRLAADLTPVDELAGAANAFALKEKGELRLVMIARIAPIKNIAFALEALRGFTHKIRFDLYGPMEAPDYWAECQQIIAALPGNVSVEWHGPIPREEVTRALASAHVFFMPTFGENFGHAIFEALFMGLPALISDQTVWRDLEQQQAGADLPLGDTVPFTAMIERWAAMDALEFAAWREGAQARAAQWLEQSPSVEANRALLLEAAGMGARP